MKRSILFEGKGQCTASLYPQGVESELARMRARAIESGDTVSAWAYYLKSDGRVSTAYKRVAVFARPNGKVCFIGSGIVRKMLGECR